MDDNKTERERRLAAALRANLQRRKQQARRRADAGSESAGDRESSEERQDCDQPTRKT